MNTLYITKENFRVKKIYVAAKINNVDLKKVVRDPPADKFPLGTTPAFEDGSVSLFGADAIAIHILGNKLESSKSELLQWLLWADSLLIPTVLNVLLPSLSLAKVDSEIMESGKKELIKLLQKLNEILLTRTYLMGERMSYADISVAINLVEAFEAILDNEVRTKIRNVVRWFRTILEEPHVKEVVGNIKFAENAVQFDNKKYEAMINEHKNLEKRLEKEKKQEKPNKQNIHDKKSKKTVEGKTNEQEMDDLDDFHQNEPKAVDPFYNMPKSKFILDSFKKVYSNEDIVSKALPYFWNNFDEKNFSIWFCEYKYPEDLKMAFMSCNLITGMFQRLDKLNKNAFASVCLFGSDHNLTISGIWVWKGHELVFTLCPDWGIDYESYDWKELDPKEESTKTLVNKYLVQGNVDGKELYECKIFK